MLDSTHRKSYRAESVEALSSPPENLLGKVLGGAYRIESQLDEGGMGLVYEATHVRLNRKVAVKVMASHLADDPAALARFTREAEIISQVSHPHIVQVLDFDTTESGKPYLVMEMLKGRPLDAILARHKRIDIASALRITIQAAAALAAAHRSGIVHRDLKPANIFLVDSGQQLFVKLLDFGISKRAHGSTDKEARKLTGEFDILGTPDYMAPEQALGKTAAVDHRGDQYALAVILYEMLAGTVPFHAEDTMTLLQRVIRDVPVAPSTYNDEIPTPVDEAILRALSKTPDERWPSILDFSEVLEIVAAEYRLTSQPNLGRESSIPPGGTRSGIGPNSPSADPLSHTARFEEESGMKTSPGRMTRPRSESGHEGGAEPTTGSDRSQQTDPARRKDETRRTSWHSKDPVKAVQELVDRARQELGLDNLELAVSCAESAYEIAASTEEQEVHAIIHKHQRLLSRIFERRLGRLDAILNVSASASSRAAQLSPEQAYLLSRLDGGLTVSEALDLSPLPRDRTLAELAGFLRRGLLSIG